MLRRFPFRAMASPCELLLYGEDAGALEATAREAIREVQRIERKYSRYRDDSVVTAINRSAGHPDGYGVDPETAGLLDYAATAFEQSDGAFDITSGVLREAWDFRSGRVPRQAEIDRARARVGWQRVAWHGDRIRLDAGMELDFGGFGKEYAADRAAALCREHGIRAGLVDLSGDIAVVGPHPDGSPWSVGVRDPRCAEAAATLSLSHGAIATSGDYQRCMVVGGRRYAHLLDPRTGWPVSGLASVSVVAPQCLVAGTASTVAMLKEAAGPAWLASLGLPHLCIDADGRASGTYSSASSSAPSSSIGSSTTPPSVSMPGISSSPARPGSTTT